MRRELMRMRFFLARPSEPAGPGDLDVAEDLADTLEAHRLTCVGMAANMIGQLKRIIAVIDEDGSILVMLNPRIEWGKGAYETEEGCLSLDGVRPCRRHRRIKVGWQDLDMRPHERIFEGGVAQAIQHECDHLDGILI